MLVKYEDAKRISRFPDFLKVIDFDFRDVVLIGSAGVKISDSDKKFISGLCDPLFVYFNHALLMKELQPCYPESFREMLFLRAGGGNLHGVDLDGRVWFQPKDMARLVGVFLVNPPKDFTVSGFKNTFIVSGDLQKCALQGYQKNEAGRVAPSTGYFGEAIFREAIKSGPGDDAEKAARPIYTIGFGLGSGAGPKLKSATHNIPFEEERQRQKFENGELISIGVVTRGTTPVAKRRRATDFADGEERK